MPIDIRRIDTVLAPDQSRVLLRPFSPGGPERVAGIVGRIMTLPDEDVAPTLSRISSEFRQRHKDIERRFQLRFEQVRAGLDLALNPSAERQLLIGAYFLAEYSLESAALFNPSIVPHPDQSGLSKGSLRFILSLRAVGEGHVSSITFRTGVIHPDHRIEVSQPARFLTEPHQIPNPVYERELFGRKLGELGLSCEFSRRILCGLANQFALDDLRIQLADERARLSDSITREDETAAKGIWLLARSNYEVEFQPEQPISERILFPVAPSQSNGIEDARFVCFKDENGEKKYYATFTAFNGTIAVPELVETTDFLHFRFITLNGPAARNKGMALFPRRVGGQYAMLSRQDNENIFIMFSDNVHFWNEHQLLLKPIAPWEMIQIGNCGSPIETDAGWLVLSHGVGAIRKYSIGAFLLDRDDPRKVIGRLREPLIEPDESEREGYVPNVVYTCGLMLHGTQLIIPYGLSDHSTGFATVSLASVLGAMR